MNLDSLLKADEKEYLLRPATEKRPAVPQNSAMLGNIPTHRPVPAGSPRLGARSSEEKRLTPKLLWKDMLTNALIVIVIASVSYFFIAARTIRPLETSSVHSDSELAELQ